MQCYTCFRCGDAFDISAIPRAIEHALLECKHIKRLLGQKAFYNRFTDWTDQEDEEISEMTKLMESVMDDFKSYEPPSQNRKEFLSQWKNYLELNRSLNHNQRKGVIFKSVPEGLNFLKAIRCTEPECGGIRSTNTYLSKNSLRSHRQTFRNDHPDDTQSHMPGRRLEDEVTVFIPPKMRTEKGATSGKLLSVIVMEEPTIPPVIVNIADQRINTQAQTGSKSTFSLRDGLYTDPRFKKEMLEFIGLNQDTRDNFVQDMINTTIDSFMRKNKLDLMSDIQEDRTNDGDYIRLGHHLLNKIYNTDDRSNTDAERIKSLWLTEMIANLAGKMVCDSCFLGNKVLEREEDGSKYKRRGKRSYSHRYESVDFISVLTTLKESTMRMYATKMRDLIGYAVRCWSLSMLAHLYPNVAPTGKHDMKYLRSDLKEALGVKDIEIEIVERTIGSISDLLN